jgi:ketosteroid isomerase-like protein
MIKKTLSILLATAACGGSHTKTTNTTPPPPPKVDAAAAKKAVLDDIQAHAAMPAQDNVDGFINGYTEDAVTLGSAPGDVLPDRAALKAKLADQVAHQKQMNAKAEMKIQDEVVGVAPSGQAAWAEFGMTFHITMPDGKSHDSPPFRDTVVLVQKDGAWQIAVEDHSHAVSDQDAMQMAANGKFLALAPIPAQVDKGAEAIADLFKKHVASLKDFAGAIAASPDTIFVGSAPADVVIGGDKVQAMMQQILPMNPKMTIKDGVRATMAPSGDLGWVMANVDFSMDMQGKTMTEPFRLLVVYGKQADGSWKVVLNHASNAVPDPTPPPPAPTAAPAGGPTPPASAPATTKKGK